ncbi:glycosyltransferase family 2 protein [Roseiconus nitratireducens]|nr:glycosyltransferase family 2 protein [Roseiconus nitratireducens]
MSSTKLSVILPVRDREREITGRVERVLEALTGLTREAAEVVVVDDGSRDATPEVLDELRAIYPQVRVVRHSRPRGIEAAGQTGLERSTGDLIFIQESDAEVRLDDLQRLLRMSDDPSIVAARAESRSEPLAPSLLRRLRAFGTNADQQVRLRSDDTQNRSLQMIRRPHLQRLAGPKGNRLRLEGETKRTVTVQNVR